MEKDNIKKELKEYVSQHFFPEDASSELGYNTPLISTGVIDSISTMKLVDHIEQQYDFQVEPHEVDQENLDTIEIMADFICKKKDGA